MSHTWDPDHPEPDTRIGPLGWIKVVIKTILLAFILVLGVILTLMLRLIEVPLFKQYRPITPYITVFVCKLALKIIGIRYKIIGKPLRGRGAMVANHTSWLDIFALNAACPLYFVSKAEVSGWLGIGILARVTGTVFIKRDRSEAKSQLQVFRDRFMNGHRLVFFPEGTSTDGRRVLPFKSTLFAAFLDKNLINEISLQPISLVYKSAPDEPNYQYGWWGGMAFGPSFLRVLAARQGSVTMVCHDPIKVSDHPNRKTLAKMTEDKVRLSLMRAGVLDTH